MVAAGCATHQRPPVVSEEPIVDLNKSSVFFTQESAPAGVFSEYLIAPGDELDVLYQITTWRQQEGDFVLAVDHTVSVKFPRQLGLDETERIRPDGCISLPHLGQVKVVGKTVRELSEELRTRYAEILKDPELYVVVPEFRSAIKELKADLHTAPRGLSRLVTVRPDGFATFAMVGDQYVAGQTVPEVNRILNEKYKTILPGLSVDLFLEKTAGSLIYVLGEVTEPGPKKILKPTAVIEALALAGSHTPKAKLGEVIIVRRSGDKLKAGKMDVREALRKKESQFFYLQPDDIVYVPKRAISRMGEAMRDIADIVLFNGWGVGISFEMQTSRTKNRATTVTTSAGPAGTTQTTSTTTSQGSQKYGF
jgi:polysaccharide export outer membrane protein